MWLLFNSDSDQLVRQKITNTHTQHTKSYVAVHKDTIANINI